MSDVEQDPFAGGTEIGSDVDPFGGDDFAGFADITSPLAPSDPEPVGDSNLPSTDELPVVNKEGEQVGTAPVEAAPTPAEAAQQSMQSLREHREKTDRQAALRDMAQREAAEAAQVATGATEAPPEPQVGPQTPETAPVTQEAPEPVAVAVPVAEPVTPDDEPDVGIPDEAEPEDAPLPKETTDKAGKVTKRLYLVYRVAAPGKLEQVFWYEDAKGNMTSKKTPGSKRQSVCVVRSAQDALKIGYAALGSPDEGVKLVAVAALHFQEKTVAPAPIIPTRVRLEITG
jgi:hypothetical protein